MTKALSKRIRITKNGKVVRRPMAQDHFRTRQSQKTVRHRRKTTGLNHPMKQLLSY